MQTYKIVRTTGLDHEKPSRCRQTMEKTQPARTAIDGICRQPGWRQGRRCWVYRALSSSRKRQPRHAYENPAQGTASYQAEREGSFTALCSKHQQRMAITPRLISDGMIAPYGQFVKFSLPDLARRYRRRILVFTPINILLSWTIQNRIAAGLAEVIPGPFYEGFNLGTRGSEQRSMHSHPSSKSNCAPHFVAFLTHLGHGAVTPDHRHNAFVEIFKWFPWCARNVSQDILGAPLAGLFGHRGKLGQRLAVFPADVREVPQGVNVGKARHREIWLNINASAMTRLDSHLVRQRRSL